MPHSGLLPHSTVFKFLEHRSPFHPDMCLYQNHHIHEYLLIKHCRKIKMYLFFSLQVTGLCILTFVANHTSLPGTGHSRIRGWGRVCVYKWGPYGILHFHGHQWETVEDRAGPLMPWQGEERTILTSRRRHWITSGNLTLICYLELIKSGYRLK